mmetsp:Transcript_14243/g.41793  ORF Transcript_14243/g.41793 Transcript_14243/m.41793 type:complete len:660 (-) Transcript_14243:212-2191(-)
MSSGNVDSAVRVDDTDQSSGNDAERERGEPGAGAGDQSKEHSGGEDGTSAVTNEIESSSAEANPNGYARFQGQQASFQQQNKFHYGNYHQGTPPPPSPTVGSTGGYDIQSLLMQQHAAMAQQEAAGTAGSFGTQYNSGVPPAPPLTPTHAAATVTMGVNASNNVPASPLFTAPSPLVYPRNPLNRLDSPAISKMAESSMASPLSPLPYLTPQALPGSPAVAGYGGILQGGGATNRDGTNPSLPADNVGTTWSDSLLSSQQQQHGFQQNKGSPYLQPHNVPGQFQLGMSSSESNHSSHSFDEMLPSAAYGGRDPNQGMYPYPNRPVPPAGMSQGVGNGPYSHPQWGGFYSGNRGPPGPYGPQGSWNMPGGGYRERGAFPGRPVGPPLGSGPGQNYYAATTPGPPIQTSPCNKGPDGANLFIFHIPNHFTNLDMYNLFCHYGNLLSVRIMVDKDTGRSRGFGFVSYDSPDAAAMAIKELNGFVIGNKRLKVQHKQIRPGEQQMGGPSPQHYQHPQQYHAPPSVGTLTTESSTTGADTVESGQLSQWHNPPSSENPNPSSGAPYAPLEGGRTVGETVGHPGTKAESIGIDAPGGANDESIGRASQIRSQDGKIPSNGKDGPNLSQVGISSFPTGSATNVSGSSDSPLAHLDSIRNALPDVSK